MAKLDFNHGLLKATEPLTLKEFYARVMYEPIPDIPTRAALFEAYGLGQAIDYLGSDYQNILLLQKLYEQAEF